MREDLRCALDGVEMGSLDARLYVEDIEERVKTAVETGGRPGWGRTAMGRPERESLTVTVRFMVKEADPARRRAVIDRVNGWAKPGWLTIGARPEQRLYVSCAAPADSATLRWSEGLQVAFTAYDGACWQDRYPATARLNGTAGSACIAPRGTRECLLDAEIENVSGGVVNAVSLSVNGRTMAFAGLGLAAGQKLTIDHDPRRLLRATADGAGRLACRTAESADDLTLIPAARNTVYFTADGACGVTLRARGEYD